MDKTEINRAVADFVRLCEEGLRDLRRTHPVFAMEDPRERRTRKLLKKVRSKRIAPESESLRSEKNAFVITGPIYHLLKTTYSVDELQFELDNRTWIFGELGPGVLVRVVGIIEKGGQRRATRIIVQ